MQAEKVVVEREVHDQLLQLHAMQLQLHAKAGQTVDSDSIKDRMVGHRPHTLTLLSSFYYVCPTVVSRFLIYLSLFN